MAAPQASSRLEMLQARFQQKQLQEKEQKLLQLYDQQQQRAYQVVQKGSAGSNGSNHGSTVRTTTTTHATSTSQGGKVRQMFDERRQTTVKGIDRSYPLEPLENRLRRQTNGNVTTQRNGNSTTVNRQSVSVRRVARADVNSNVNGGKPVVTYHEEIARESFGPSARHDDVDEFDVENRVANGHYRHDEQEVLDHDTIDRNRMMAKIHLMGFDETLKNRVRNDLESEEFPDYLMVDVPEKLPKRNVTKKLSQAEARLERFKNANAKRSNMPKQSNPTSTVIKKRSEQIVPARSNSGRIAGIFPSGGAGSARFTDLNQRTLGNRKTLLPLKSVKSRVTDDIYKKRKENNPDVEILDRRDSPRSFSGSWRSFAKPESTSWTYHPGSNDFKSPRDGKIFVKPDASPRFFCKESEKSATTMSIEPKSDSSGSPLFYRQTTERPSFFLHESEQRRSGTIGKSDSPVSDRISSRQSSSSPLYPFRESERYETTTLNAAREATGPKSVSRAGKRNTAPQFYCKESERSATTMSIDRKVSEFKSHDRAPKRGTSPGEKFNERRSTKLSNVARREYDELSGIARGTSPQFFCKESEKSATTMLIEPRSSPTRSILKQRNYASPHSFYEQSLSSNKKVSSARDHRSRHEVKTIAKGNEIPDAAVTQTRRSSKISETSASTSSIASLKYSLEFDNILQSAGLVKKFIRSQCDGERRDARRSPTKRDIKNVNASRNNKSKSGLDTWSLSRKTRSPIPVESKTKFTLESPRKSVTPIEVDMEIQEITMTDHRIESDKLRRATTPKRQNNGTYTKSIGDRTKSKPWITYPVLRKTHKQRKSILESDVFKSRRDFSGAKDHRRNRNDEKSTVGFSTGSSQRVTRREELRFDQPRSLRSAQLMRDTLKDKTSLTKDENARGEDANKIVASNEVNDQINVKYQTIVESALSGKIKGGKDIRSFGQIPDRGGSSRKPIRAPMKSSTSTRDTISPKRGCGRQHDVKPRISLRVSKKTEISRGVNVPRSSSRKIIPKGDRYSKCLSPIARESATRSFDKETGAIEKSTDAVRQAQKALTRREDKCEHDLGRMDSVESALRRFDSIGAESEFPSDRASSAISLRMMDAKPRVGESSASTIIFFREMTSNKISNSTARSSESVEDREMKTAARKRDLKILGKQISPSRKLAKLGNSIENKRAPTQTRSTCKRQLFASDLKKKTRKESSDAKTRKKANYISVNRKSRKDDTGFGSCEIATRESEEETSTVSVKPLRSIEDIRKSIDNERSAQTTATVTKESRSAIANRCSVWRDGDAKGSIRAAQNAFLVGDRARSIKAKSCISRITKSPSPDPAARKHETNTRAIRGSASSSFSKSPDIPSRRESTELKNQDAKPSRKSVTAKGADLTEGKEAGTFDAADGIANDSPHESATKKSSAFVIDFNGSSKEDDIMPSRKPPMRKTSSDKQQITPNTGRSSSSSNSSVSLSQISSAKDKMISRARTSASDLVACKTCGRHFAQDRISLHQQICEKTLKKERKKFDTVLFRTRGTDLEPFVKKGFTKKQEAKLKKQSPAKPDWRRKHEEFINAIRYAKQAQAYQAAGKDLRDLPPPPPSDTSDYIQCPHCNRKFNQAAAERHIPKCKDMQHNKPRPLRPRR